jgi:hypothetical protein
VFHDLPHGLLGALAVTATVKADPATPPEILKFTFAEEGGERFMAVRPAPVEFGVVRIPLDELKPDALWNASVPPANADGTLEPGAVKEWRLEILPASEQQVKGTVTLKDVRAVGPDLVKPRTVPPPPKPKPVVKKVVPKPAATPAPAPETTEPAGDNAAPEAPPAEGGDDMELAP